MPNNDAPGNAPRLRLLPATSPTGQADDLVSEVEMCQYRRGRVYVERLVDSVIAAVTGDPDAAAGILVTADRLLWPLGELTEAEQVRDFVAGAAREVEVRINQLVLAADAPYL